MLRGHTDCRRFFTRATTTLRCSLGIWLLNFMASRSRRSCTTTASTYHSSTSIPPVPDRPTGRCCTEEASAPLLLTSRWPPAMRKAGPQNKHAQILHPSPSKCFPSSKTSTVRHNKHNLKNISPRTSKNLKAQQEVDHQNFDDDPKAINTLDNQSDHSFFVFLHFYISFPGFADTRVCLKRQHVMSPRKHSQSRVCARVSGLSCFAHKHSSHAPQPQALFTATRTHIKYTRMDVQYTHAHITQT